MSSNAELLTQMARPKSKKSSSSSTPFSSGSGSSSSSYSGGSHPGPQARFDSLASVGFPSYDRLKLLPGISKFLVPELIPDLLSILSEPKGEETLLKMIEEFDKRPEQPLPNLLFLDPYQKEYEYTKEVEKDLVKNIQEVEESETMECSNTKCKSKKILARPVQANRGDEGVSYFTLCTECGRRERRRA